MKTLTSAVLALMASSMALAHEDDRFSCSNETLQGDYALSISGTRPAPPPPSGTPAYTVGSPEQLLGTGIRTFDGAGTFTQITNEKGSLSGLLFPDRPLQGTYSVNPDCTGTLTILGPGLPFPIVYDLVISGRGRDFSSIVVSPQAPMVQASGRRVR